jgi:hypothetical protein
MARFPYGCLFGVTTGNARRPLCDFKKLHGMQTDAKHFFHTPLAFTTPRIKHANSQHRTNRRAVVPAAASRNLLTALS